MLTKTSKNQYFDRGGYSQKLRLFLSFIAVIFVVLFLPKIDVHAGTIDANGYTVATNLSGTSYALLTDDKALYVLRTSDVLSVDDEYTYEKDGVSYTGIIQNTNLEEGRNPLGSNATKIVFLDDIQPVYLSFKSSSTVTSIEGMKEHVDTSKLTDTSEMFYGLSKLTSVDVSGFNTGKVTDMQDMFDGCAALTELDVSGFNTSNVTNMADMFYNCAKVKKLVNVKSCALM